MLLPTPLEIFTLSPLSLDAAYTLEQNRLKAHGCMNKHSTQLALVVGPCSLHDPDSVIEYAHNLLAMQKQKDFPFFLVMRAFVEKPRSYLGWKGLAYDPDLMGHEDLGKGIHKSRKLLVQLASMGIPLAIEFVNPILSVYFEDLVTWGFVGARTSASSAHRSLGSSFCFPLGFKNSIDGNILTAVLGAASARCSHTTIKLDPEGRAIYTHTSGNPFSHIVLRGSETHTNYQKLHIDKAKEFLARYNVSAKIMVDCSHGNSKKDPHNQKEVFEKVISHHLAYPEDILGIMMESFLETGRQSIRYKPLKKGVSITDACLSWEETYELIARGADQLLASSFISSSSI